MNRSRLALTSLAMVAGIGLASWLFLHPNFSADSRVAPVPTGAADEVNAAKSSSSPVHAQKGRSFSAPVDDRPFAEMRAELERRATAGDGRAARRLGMVFANCNRYVPLADDQLERWVVEAAANDLSITEGERKLAPDEILARMKLAQAQKARDCKGVVGLYENDAPALAARWIERGAALGDADAQAIYGALAFSSYDARTALADAEGILERKQRAVGYLQSSLAQGDALALLHLSSHYAEGDLYPKNAETAYAYLYAYSLTPRAADVVPEWLQQMLEAAAKPLDESTRQRARAQGVQIAACCGVALQEGP